MRACGARGPALATHPPEFPATRFNTALTPRRGAFAVLGEIRCAGFAGYIHVLRMSGRADWVASHRG